MKEEEAHPDIFRITCKIIDIVENERVSHSISSLITSLACVIGSVIRLPLESKMDNLDDAIPHIKDLIEFYHREACKIDSEDQDGK